MLCARTSSAQSIVVPGKALISRARGASHVCAPGVLTSPTPSAIPSPPPPPPPPPPSPPPPARLSPTPGLQNLIDWRIQVELRRMGGRLRGSTCGSHPRTPVDQSRMHERRLTDLPPGSGARTSRSCRRSPRRRRSSSRPSRSSFRPRTLQRSERPLFELSELPCEAAALSYKGGSNVSGT